MPRKETLEEKRIRMSQAVERMRESEIRGRSRIPVSIRTRTTGRSRGTRYPLTIGPGGVVISAGTAFRKLGGLKISWQPIRDTFGEEGRRWMIRDVRGKPLEEITIEDNPESEDAPYEIVVHDFVSGDIETEDDARTLHEAQDKVRRITSRSPRGLYDSTIAKIRTQQSQAVERMRESMSKRRARSI